MFRYKLRTLLILLAVGPPVLALFFFGPFVTVWGGAFTLNVRLLNETGTGIDRIEAAVVGTRATADIYVSYPDGEQPPWKLVELDNARVAELRVNCSGHESWLGYELSYWQERAIVMRVEFIDGSQSLFATDIPAQRGVRNLVVHIPRGNQTR